MKFTQTILHHAARLSETPHAGYLLAVAGTLAAAWARWGLGRALGQDLPPYITFYPVIILSALLGGTAPGLLATMLATLLVDYLFLQPVASLWIRRPVDLLSMAIFVTVNVMITVVGGTVRRAHHHATLETRRAELSEQRYRSFVEATAHIIWATDASGQMDRPAPTWNAFTGQQDDETSGFGWMNAVHPDDRAKVTEAWKIASAARAQYEVEFRLKRYDGQWRHILARGVPVLTPGRSVREYIGTCIDVTDQRQAEDLLRRNEERFRTLAEVATQVVWLSTPSGDPAADSRSWREFTGRPPEQWFGSNWLEAIHPEDRSHAATVWHTAIECAHPYLDEYRLLHASGIYRHVQARAVPVRHPDGTVREWIGTLTDITTSKRAENARATLAAIIADSGDAVISKDLDGRINSWNPAAERLFGYTAEQMLGKNIRLLIPPERQEEEDRILAATRRGERIEHYESQRLTRDDRLIDVAITTSPIRDSYGHIIGVSKIARDITQRKAAEAEIRLHREHLEELVHQRTVKLNETVAELEAFSYALVHDMRAPLRAMQAYATCLQEDAGSRLRPEEFDLLRKLKLASKRMDQLITDSLNYSLILREELPLGTVNLSNLLRGILETYPNMQPPDATVILEIDDLSVSGNEAALTQVFSNLLANAVKFVAPGIHPRVRIWAEKVRGQPSSGMHPALHNSAPNSSHPPSTDQVLVWIEDNGIGIPRDQQEKIFGIFQRLHRTDDYPGTGIGLSIVRKTLERVGGQVCLDSEPGKGSRFCVQLPLAPRSVGADQLRHAA